MADGREKRPRSLGPESSSPGKKPSRTTPRTRHSRKGTSSRERVAKVQHTPPPYTTSSPPKTPKSPSGALKLGLNKSTAKSLLKHGSKITPLYNMLYGFAHMIIEYQPRSEEEFKPLLDQLAGQLVNLLSPEFSFLSLPFHFFLIAYTQDSKLLERKTFSAILTREFEAMCKELNLKSGGTIQFAEPDVLLGDIAIPDSFRQQVELVRHINVSAVRILI